MKFEIFKGTNDKFYFRLKARNGQVILNSQGYANKAGAKNGIESVQKNCGDDSCYEIKESKNGKPYFNLLASNKQVIGSSQMYASMASLKSGVAAVKKASGSAAKVVDLSAE